MTRRDGVVLVIADALDSTADRVCDALASRDSRLFRFDTAEFPGRLQFRAQLDGGAWRGELTRGGDRVELEDIRSVYVRRPRPFEVPAHLTVAERWHAATECATASAVAHLAARPVSQPPQPCCGRLQTQTAQRFAGLRACHPAHVSDQLR